MSQNLETTPVVEDIPLDHRSVGALFGASPAASGRPTSKTRFELVVDGTRPPSVAQGLRELWMFRSLICALAERNLRVKYKQAALGIAWALIQPLGFLAIFVTVFGRVGGLSQGMTSYPAFALSTLVPWMFLATAVSSGSQGLLSDGALIKKVYFAREAPVLAAVLSACVDFAIGLALVLLVGPFLGMRLSWATLLVIPLWGVLFALASGVAMALAALAVYYRDVRHALPFALQLWMFASPVAYPLSVVPEKWRGVYIVANPASGILDGFRRTMAEGRVPDPGLLAISVATTLTIACVGYLIFKRMEAEFADTI